MRISARKQKRKLSDDDIAPPPPYNQVVSTPEARLRALDLAGGHSTLEARRRRKEHEIVDMDAEKQQQQDDCCCWPWFLQNRPILRLFLVICFNGLVSMMCAAIFIELEKPSQDERFEVRAVLESEVKTLKRNLTMALKDPNLDPAVALKGLKVYRDKLEELSAAPEEIKWDMLAASAFVTSVSSTTGIQR